MTKAKAKPAAFKAGKPRLPTKPAPQTSAARLEVVPLARLHNDPHNVNKHTQRGHTLVEQSIRRRGVARPGFAAYNKAGELVVLGGNLSSLEIPADIGLDEAVLVYTDGKRPIIHVRQDIDAESDDARLLALEDNVAGVASYDPDVAMLADLTEIEGFDDIISEREYRKLVAAAVLAGDEDGNEGAEPQIDRAAELAKEWGVVRGQVWACGNHRVMCGDSTNAEDVARLMNGARADAVIADPPYGANFDPMKDRRGPVGGKAAGGKVVRSIARPKLVGDEDAGTARSGFALWQGLAPLQVWWGANYYADALPPSSCWFVWDKENTGDFADVELAWHNKPRAARIFRHMWNGMLKDSERGERRIHGTQKPIALYAWCIDQMGDGVRLVADPFCGSGISLLACEQMGRVCYAMEIDPGYTAVTLQRYQDTTGIKPVLIHDSEG